MIRLKEAFARAKELGLVRRKSDLAREIWSNSTAPKGAYMNFLNLERGKTKKIDIDAIVLLCEKLAVTPEYLFGMSDNPSIADYEADVKEKAEEIIRIAQSI